MVITPTDLNEIATACKSLSDPTRLRILQYLASCCEEVDVDEKGAAHRTKGVTAGSICCEVTGGMKVTSNISHHLKELKNAGLIKMRKDGRMVRCSLDRDRLQQVEEFVQNLLNPTNC